MDIENDGVLLQLSGLGGRYHAIVSREDYENVSKHHWIAHGIKQGRYVYAVRYVTERDETGKSKKRRIYLHRELLRPPQHHLVVDHANQNTLDNRRSNLRLATRSENSSNSDARPLARSGYRGVYVTRSGTFRACIRRGGKTIHIGTYRDAAVAARVRDAAVFHEQGAFAVLNFPAAVLEDAR